MEEQVDQQCAAAAAFHYQQQLRLDVSHPVQSAASPAAAPASSSQSSVSASVRSLTAASSSAHRYRLYTDSLIDVGLHHESELRRQWVAMETQARSINRSAERAARRDMRETVREIVSAAKAGRCNEVRDKLKEATQHRDEANEARNSRAAIYTDRDLYLPMARSRQREEAVLASMAGEKSSVGHLSMRQALFDPVPQTNEFERPVERHVSDHQFRDDGADQRNDTEIALPAVVDTVKRRMDRIEKERDEKDGEDLKRVHKAEKRHRTRTQQMHRSKLAQLPVRELSNQPISLPPQPFPASPPPQPAPPLLPPQSAASHRPRTVTVTSRHSSSQSNRRPSTIRAPLWTQGQGDVMLAEVSQFTLLRSKEAAAAKEDERRAIAEDERRTREQWLADERREQMDREEKEQADVERRQREQVEDEREDCERRLRFFPQPPRHESEQPVEQSAEAADERGDGEASDHFSHTAPLPAALSRSPERSHATLSSLDGLQRRRSSIAVGARRISLIAAAGASGNGHRRRSSLLPPASPTLSSSRTSTSRSSHRSSLAASAAFPLSQVRSRWQNAAGKTGAEHLARRFSLVAPAQPQQQNNHQHSTHQPQHQRSNAQSQPQYQHPALAAMLPSPIDPDSSLVATNYSHDPLHSTYLQRQREQRRTATAQVYDIVKRWLEEQEEERHAAGNASGDAANRASSLSFDPELVTPFSSVLAHQPYSPRSQQRHRSMRQQLPLSVSNPAVFAWMRRHAIVPRRTIDPSEEVKVGTAADPATTHTRTD